MAVDLFSILLVTALVVLVAGVTFLLETALRRDFGPGRVWSLAFLAGILTTICYLIWATTPDAWVATAIGNGAFVASAACLWLGCRAYNGKALAAPGWVSAAVAAAAVAAVLVFGPAGGDWAGAPVMFAAIALFAAFGAIESRTGRMGTSLTAIGLTFVLGLEAAYYLVRTVVFLVDGPEGEVFVNGFGTPTTAFLTVTLTIVAVVTVSVLRAANAVPGPAEEGTIVLTMGEDAVFPWASFEVLIRSLLANARNSTEIVAVTALTIADLPQIGAAFGVAEQNDIVRQWRASVRRTAPIFGPVGTYDPTVLMVAFAVTSVGDARRIAGRIQRRLLDDFASMGASVIPVVGVGVALTDSLGYDLNVLGEAARGAAQQSTTSPDASVIIAELG